MQCRFFISGIKLEFTSKILFHFNRFLNFESFSNVISNQVFDNKNWRTFQLIARTWELIARNCFNFGIRIFRFSKILTFFTLWINYKLVSRYQEWSKTGDLEDWVIKYTVMRSKAYDHVKHTIFLLMIFLGIWLKFYDLDR